MSSHIGEEVTDAMGRSYDFVGSAAAYNRGNLGQVLNSILTHLDKAVDFVVIDLRGASKEQIAAIMEFISRLSGKQRFRLMIVR